MQYDDIDETFEDEYGSGPQACRSGDLERITHLLKSGLDVNTKSKFNIKPTLLILAASNGHKRIVDLLLSKGADVNAKTTCGNTALMRACRGGHWKIVQSLLQSRSIDINSINETSRTALMWATSIPVTTGHLKCIKLLLEQNADTRLIDYFGMTATMYCAWQKRPKGLESMKLLIEAGADRNVIGIESLIMLAADNGNPKILLYLLKNATIDKHHTNQCGDNALIVALKSEQKNSSRHVEILLQAGWDPNSQSGAECKKLCETCSRFEIPALHIAAAKTFEKTRLLLSYGAIPKLSYLFGNESYGTIFSPLDVAVYNRKFTTANFFLSFVGCHPFTFGPYYDRQITRGCGDMFERRMIGIVNEMIKIAEQCPGLVQKIRDHTNKPLTLEIMCSRVVSQMAGISLGRRDRLLAAGLPPPLIRLIMMDVEAKDFIMQINRFYMMLPE